MFLGVISESGRDCIRICWGKAKREESKRNKEAAFGGMKSRVRISLLRRDLLLGQSGQK
jgi:hypothetical protein